MRQQSERVMMARRRSGWILAAAALVTTAAGCGSLLEVDSPSQIPAEEAIRPENAALLMNSAIGDFECAFAGTVALAGLLGDETANASFGNTLWQIDRRDMSPGAPIGTAGCTNLVSAGGFASLSVARYQAEELARNLALWTDAQVPNRAKLQARSAAYAGYSYVFLAETMCSGAVDAGPELTKAQMFSLAEVRFTTAISGASGAGGDADVLNMSLVGRARARLNLGNRAGAAADARQVPTGFRKDATYSAIDTRRENPLFSFINRGGFFTIGPLFRGVNFNGVPDPRVPVADAGINGGDNLTPLWIQNKYTSVSAPIAIAKWEEAQLIIAETELAAGNLQNAVAIINLLHSRTTPALPPFASSGAAAIQAQLLYERRAELFLEGQHLNDNVRFNTPLVPAPGTPFPIGGGFFGTQRCFFLPDLERNTNGNI